MTTTDPRRDHAIAAYRAGASTRTIAARLDVDPRTVARWAAQADALRPVGAPRRNVTDARIVRLRDQGMSFAAISREVGMSKSGVINRYHAATEGMRRDRRS